MIGKTYHDESACRNGALHNGVKCRIRVVLFDFGGVIAEEGFREGLRALAGGQGLDPDAVYRAGTEAVYDSGYVLGKGDAADFWAMMRMRTGLTGADEELNAAILRRFTVRPRMIETVRQLRRRGFVVVLLSDQTDWLEQLDRNSHFIREFDRVFNSYRLGKGKRDPSLFADVAASLGISPQEGLFFDDTPANVERAARRGFRAVLFESEDRFLTELDELLGGQTLSTGC